MAKPGSIERLNERLRAIPKAVREAVYAADAKSAQELVREMKRNAPVEDGTLRNSIHDEQGALEGSKRVVAGGDATTVSSAAGPYDYALGQEYGTKERQANPFFRPAIRKLKKRINNRRDREARKAIKAHWGKP